MTSSPQGTPHAQQQAPLHGRPDLQAAVFGLLGAIIGGLATFGGAYWTGHQEQTASQIVAQRSAYATYLSAADEYQTNLIQLRNSLEYHDPSSYEKAQQLLIAQIAPLYSDTVLIRYISTRTVGDDAQAALKALFIADVRAEFQSASLSQISTSISDGSKMLGTFEDDSYAVLNS